MDWRTRIREALERHRHPVDDDVVEELALHAAASFEQARADGASADEAHARVGALVEGWCASGAARLRPRRTPIVEPPLIEPSSAIASGGAGIGRDLRYGLRQMRRQPGFALTAVLLVALGVGAATTLFTLTYSVLLKPLNWPDADRTITLVETREGATRQTPNTLTNATYLAWRDHPETISAIAAYASRSVTVTGSDQAERIRAVAGTASLFDVLSAHPVHGALFTAADETPDRPRVIVISYNFWQRRFGGRADAIDQTLELDGQRYRIAAVMPGDFAFPAADVAAWMPMHVTPVIDPANPDARAVSLFRGIAKLKPGMTAAQAAAEGTARGRSAPDLGMVGTAMFGTQGKPIVSATPFLAALTRDVQTALSLLVAAVALLLLVAVANIAGVQLARAASRRREMAIRGALGATMARLSRQLFTENLLMGLAGGVAGSAIALLVLSVLPDLLPADFPRRDAIGLDWRVFVISMGAGLIASVFFGFAATMVARRTNLVGALVEDSLAPAGLSTRSVVGRWRTFLMVGQVAVATLLLAGALLLGRSFIAALDTPRGYDPSHVLTAVLPVPDARMTSQQRAAMLDAIVDRAAQLPGVTATAASSVLPLVPFDQPNGFTWAAGPGHPQAQLVQTHVRLISPGYFATLRIPIIEGRALTEHDTTTSPRVAVVNRAFARKYIQGSAIGVQLPTSFEASPGGTEIVGVAEDVLMQSASDVPQPEVFTSYRQRHEGMRVTSPVISVRASGDPASLAPVLRDIVRQQSPSLVLDSVMTLDDRLVRSLARPRLYAVTFATFAIFTLLVAGAGLYGVLSYNVTQRRRELGVRSSLGASRTRILALVAKQGLAITAAGLVVGLGSAALLTQFASSLLFGVTARDPVTFVIVPVVVCAVATLAILIPARRAVQIDPLIALKGD